MKLSTYFNHKLQKLTLIASLFAFGTYCNAVPVPATAKFRSVTYDATTKHFIAVGDADLMAVSTDGRHWDYHKVIPQNNTRASGISYNNVFFGDNQTLYILSQSEDLLKRESASLTDAGQWKFTKVVQNRFKSPNDLVGNIHQIYIPLEYRMAEKDENDKSIPLREFFLQKVGNENEITGAIGLYRMDHLHMTGTVVPRTKRIKEGKLYNLQVGLNKNDTGYSSSLTLCDDSSLLRSTNWGNSFTTILKSPICESDDTMVASHQPGMPIIEVIFDPETEGSSVCDLSAQPSPRCTPVPAMTGHHAEAVAATAHGAAVAVSDDDGSLHKTKVITGNLSDTGVFTVNASSAEFAVARRTCAATNNDLTIMLGEDNKVLLSTDGRTWSMQPMLAR